MAISIKIENTDLKNWISRIEGNNDEKQKYIENTLNLGRICLESCKLNPNFDMITYPIDKMANQLEERINQTIVSNREIQQSQNEKIDEKIDLLMLSIKEIFTIGGSSNKKGKLVEDIIEQNVKTYFPNYELENKSNTPHEADFHLKTDFGIILIELKTYTSSVNNSQIDKFKRDIDRTGIKYAIFVSNTSGIVGKKKLDWEIYNDCKIVYVSNAGINGLGLIWGIFFLKTLINSLDKQEVNLENHLDMIIDNMDQAKQSLDKLTRLKYDIYKLKDTLNKHIDELYKDSYMIEISLKKSINNVIDEINKLTKQKLNIVKVSYSEVNELLDSLQSRGEKISSIVQIIDIIQNSYKNKIKFALLNENIILMNTNNVVFATINNTKTKKEIKFNIHEQQQIILNYPSETVNNNHIVISKLELIDLIKNRIEIQLSLI